MDLPLDPIRMSPDEILANLLESHRELSEQGPEVAMAFLQRTMRDTLDLPHAVLMVLHDLISESQAELQDWAGCSASMALALEERRLALAEAPSQAVTPAENSASVPETSPVKHSEDFEGAFDHLRIAPVATTGLREASLPIAPSHAALAKLCFSCGKDVSHRARRKDPGTHTYLCRECFENHPGVQTRGGLKMGKPLLWIGLIGLLALCLLFLLRA